MAQIDFGGITKHFNAVPGTGWTISATTGTMAAALGSASDVFTMRAYTDTTKAALVYRMRVQFTTITAFTTPVTAGRRLALYRFAQPAGASNGNPSANNTNIVPLGLNPADTSSIFTLASATPNFGSMDIATTAAMTMGSNMTVAATPLRVLNLSHVGAAGGNAEADWDFPTPVFLPAGYGLTIRPPANMDAAGTWHLAVTVSWTEVGTMS